MLRASEKRILIEPEHSSVSIVQQCDLLGLARSSYYYQAAQENTENLRLMDALDRLYMDYPFFGVERMTTWLRHEGWVVNSKRIRRLLRLMGLEALAPKPNTSLPNKEHRIYPYMLRDMAVTYPNMVWCADITYIRLQGGWMYLVAVMDWYSRYVLAWELSNSMETRFCCDVLEQSWHYGRPQIFNTDQGAQFTSNAFTQKLLAKDICISMDGRGRALDNVFIERLWRSLKYEDIYLKDYASVIALERGLAAYFEFYNQRRFHQGLGNRIPEDVYFNDRPCAVQAALFDFGAAGQAPRLTT